MICWPWLGARTWCRLLDFACIKNGCRSVGVGGLKLCVLQRVFVSLKQLSKISVEILNTHSKTAPLRRMVSGGVTPHVLSLSGGTVPNG